MSNFSINGIDELDFMMIWFGSGALCWVLFVIFVGRVLGYAEFKKWDVRAAGAVFFVFMVGLGFLSITVTLTSFIPYLESFMDIKEDSDIGD